METANLSGHRICIKLCINKGDPLKCFIFLKKDWNKISDIQDHIKRIFSIEENINIFIEDILLPEKETINLIQHNDNLIIKLQTYDTTCFKNTEDVPAENDSVDKLPKKKKSRKSKPLEISDMVSVCLKKLRSEEQLEEVHPDINSGCSDVIDETLNSLPEKKKRKRKHKKKSGNITSLKFVIDQDNVNDVTHISEDKNYSNKVEGSQEHNTTENEPMCVDDSEENLNRNKINGNEVIVPNIGDNILFKKIKLGNNYAPETSGPIVGEVTSIKNSDNSSVVSFKIKKGEEEFEEPVGKFSMDDECNNVNSMSIVELDWTEVLEPRVLFTTTY